MKKKDVLSYVAKLRNEANEIAMNLYDPARAELHLVALQDAIRALESSTNAEKENDEDTSDLTLLMAKELMN